MKLPKNHFKTNLFFFNFWWGRPFSGKILVRWETWTSNLSGEAIWHLSDYSYYTEFVSWHVDSFSYFLFFLLRGMGGWGPELNGKFRYFFFFFWILPLVKNYTIFSPSIILIIGKEFKIKNEGHRQSWGSHFSGCAT